MTVKDLKYIKINIVNFLHLFIDKRNGYIEEGNGNKHLTIVSNNESKYTIKMYEDLWTKIRGPIRSKLMTQMIILKII